METETPPVAAAPDAIATPAAETPETVQDKPKETSPEPETATEPAQETKPEVEAAPKEVAAVPQPAESAEKPADVAPATKDKPVVSEEKPIAAKEILDEVEDIKLQPMEEIQPKQKEGESDLDYSARCYQTLQKNFIRYLHQSQENEKRLLDKISSVNAQTSAAGSNRKPLTPTEADERLKSMSKDEKTRIEKILATTKVLKDQYGIDKVTQFTKEGLVDLAETDSSLLTGLQETLQEAYVTMSAATNKKIQADKQVKILQERHERSLKIVQDLKEKNHQLLTSNAMTVQIEKSLAGARFASTESRLQTKTDGAQDKSKEKTTTPSGDQAKAPGEPAPHKNDDKTPAGEDVEMSKASRKREKMDSDDEMDSDEEEKLMRVLLSRASKKRKMRAAEKENGRKAEEEAMEAEKKAREEHEKKSVKVSSASGGKAPASDSDDGVTTEHINALMDTVGLSAFFGDRDSEQIVDMAMSHFHRGVKVSKASYGRKPPDKLTQLVDDQRKSGAFNPNTRKLDLCAQNCAPAIAQAYKAGWAFAQ